MEREREWAEKLERQLRDTAQRMESAEVEARDEKHQLRTSLSEVTQEAQRSTRRAEEAEKEVRPPLVRPLRPSAHRRAAPGSCAPYARSTTRCRSAAWLSSLSGSASAARWTRTCGGTRRKRAVGSLSCRIAYVSIMARQSRPRTWPIA